jgi:hypothetical protein
MADELDGVKELTAKLNRLDAALVVKSLRSVLFKATTPVVGRMKATMPVGTQAHRTYKGNLVTPGYSKRSIRRLTGKRYLSRGLISIAIGVKADAFYAIRFYDQGPYTIVQRRQSTNRKARGHVGMQRRKTSIKPYTLKKVPWFETVFRASEPLMLNGIKKNLKDVVSKIAKTG